MVADDIAAAISGADPPAPYEGSGVCYAEFGTGLVSKVEINFLRGEQPEAKRYDPSQGYALEKHEFCQKLGFSPWHALREHRPLGNIMRARRLAYEGSREHRGGMDEPTGDEFQIDAP